jgi:hypothetical protein
MPSAGFSAGNFLMMVYVQTHTVMVWYLWPHFMRLLPFCIDDNRQVNRRVIQQKESHIGSQNIPLGSNQAWLMVNIYCL